MVASFPRPSLPLLHTSLSLLPMVATAMGKNQKKDTGSSSSSHSNGSDGVKVKRTKISVARDSSRSQRSSVYRIGGRDDSRLICGIRTAGMNPRTRKGNKASYGDEEAAARAYDLAALKYWGHNTILNFPISTYQDELEKMEGQSKEEYIGSLRRKSSGFSRGVSRYRGVARHHHSGKWEARLGRVFGNKYLYLGTYATQEEAAAAYDMAAIEHRGLSAVTNFDLSRYVEWLRPSTDGHATTLPSQVADTTAEGAMTASPALGLLLQSSSKLERRSAERKSPPQPPPPPPPPYLSSSRPSKCSFPEDIQTYFECQDSEFCLEGEDSNFWGCTTFMDL
ncbi:AP2-like ethylene-responsive transcription factor [Musa troglodytarum]|uniref:AP2-like ethylene-responsive transcription factor n=1 Tax=Musa troglodytarum TaxID=320322 RepID=A0A9E7G5E7_9LILI|nr:AP2-like ethylene-responsive transcription factor [Musa troglodytarum]